MDGNTNTHTDANTEAVAMEEEDAAKALMGDLGMLETELANQKNLYLRLAADFDNFRKRTAQEMERRAAAQKEAFIRDLLPVIDNLERALNPKTDTSPEQLREGVQMTLQQLKQLLRRNGIEPEESDGQPFDPHRQEAVATREDPARPDHSVLETFQAGYRRNKEVFRPAKVVVNNLSQAEPTDKS
ncbi:MAG: Heat shock protein GrpE [Pedosphaera sp.]|nr:Heat shock protein GrpE [Pedosphaera sp.]